MPNKIGQTLCTDTDTKKRHREKQTNTHTHTQAYKYKHALAHAGTVAATTHVKCSIVLLVMCFDMRANVQQGCFGARTKSLGDKATTCERLKWDSDCACKHDKSSRRSKQDKSGRRRTHAEAEKEASIRRAEEGRGTYHNHVHPLLVSVSAAGTG